MFLPIDGSLEEMPGCPAAFLRTGADIQMLTERFGKEPFAEHLIEGTTHPYSLVAPIMSEIENGARSADSVSPKLMELVHIGFREQAAKREYERKHRKDK